MALHSLHDANKETTKMAFVLIFATLCMYCIYSVFVNENWHLLPCFTKACCIYSAFVNPLNPIVGNKSELIYLQSCSIHAVIFCGNYQGGWNVASLYFSMFCTSYMLKYKNPTAGLIAEWNWLSISGAALLGKPHKKESFSINVVSLLVGEHGAWIILSPLITRPSISDQTAASMEKRLGWPGQFSSSSQDHSSLQVWNQQTIG